MLQGPFTREDGFLGYNEICVKQIQDSGAGPGWRVQWEESYSAPFMFRGDQWLSYDNERSIQAKTEYAHDQGLAGVMTWSIDTDDFLGVCNGPKFPLLRTINYALYNKQTGQGSGAGVVSVNLSCVVIGLLVVVCSRKVL